MQTLFAGDKVLKYFIFILVFLCISDLVGAEERARPVCNSSATVRMVLEVLEKPKKLLVQSPLQETMRKKEDEKVIVGKGK